LSLPKLLALAGTVVAFHGAPPPAHASGVQCGDTITQNTRLDADLVNCPGDGIVIGADHVTLDLNGHTIDGQGNGGGVLATGRRDVEVKEGAIQGFARGVSFDGVTRAAARRVALGGNGISCVSSEGCTIEGNSVFGAGISVVHAAPGAPTVIRRNVVRGADAAGVTVNFTSGETTVEKNLLEGNGSGIEALHSSVGRISDNTIRANGADGIRASLGGDSRITHNLIWRNGTDGIALDHFVDAQVFGNYVARNRGHGIHGQALARPLLEDNVVVRNGGNGIFLEGFSPIQEPTSFAVLTGNFASRNARDGIAIAQTTHNSDLDGNRTLRNGDDGIDVRSATTTLTANRARRNADLGIEAVAGVTDAAANRARRNGDPAQCTHVRC
jgi:Periplasmic copper-binding protein (NosD)